MYSIAHEVRHPLSYLLNSLDLSVTVRAGLTLVVLHLRWLIRLACAKSCALMWVVVVVPSLHVAILTSNSLSFIIIMR